MAKSVDDETLTTQTSLISILSTINQKLRSQCSRRGLSMSTLGMLNNQYYFVTRKEMYESFGRLRELYGEKLGENTTLIYQVNGKLGKLDMFEKANKYMIKQKTRGDNRNKIIDMKMNTGQAQAKFNSYIMKLATLQLTLNKLRTEMQSNSTFLRMLQTQMNEPQESINIIRPKQKVSQLNAQVKTRNISMRA